MANSICELLNITKAHNHDTAYCITPKYINNEQLSAWNQQVDSRLKGQTTAIQMRMDDYSLVLAEDRFKFEYVNDPKILSIGPDRTITSGGLLMAIQGRDFENIQTASIVISALHGDSNEDLNSVG